MLNKNKIDKRAFKKTYVQQACKKRAYLHMLHTEPKVQVSDTTKADSSNTVYYIKKRHAKYAQRLILYCVKIIYPFVLLPVA